MPSRRLAKISAAAILSQSSSYALGDVQSAGFDALSALPAVSFAIGAGAVAYGLFAFFAKQKAGFAEFADESAVASRSAEASKLLHLLSEKDESWDEGKLRSIAQGAYLQVFKSISGQNAAPLRRLLRQDLFIHYRDKIQSDIDSGSREVFENLKVERAEIVLVRSFAEKVQDVFVAWVRASGSKYDVAPGELPSKGKRHPQNFEHFLSFQRDGDGWLLFRLEEYSDASHLLHTGNIFETIPSGVPRQKIAPPFQSCTPLLHDRILRRAGRAEAMLSKLSKSENHWDEAELVEFAKGAYDSYYSCLAARDFRPIDYLLAPGIREHVKKISGQMRATGVRVEARELCVRDVEIVLVKNRQGGQGDEFTAWVRANAQVVQLNPNGEIVGGDSQPRIFEEYMTFVRKGRWLLEEMTPPEVGDDRLDETDVDEGDLPIWLDWYYRLLPPDKNDGA